jgi:hypothetical protein
MLCNLLTDLCCAPVERVTTFLLPMSLKYCMLWLRNVQKCAEMGAEVLTNVPIMSPCVNSLFASSQPLVSPMVVTF